MAYARLRKRRVRTAALLLRATPYADSDLIVRLFTEELGAVSALARGARKSRKRFSALEPMHDLQVELALAEGRDLVTLREAAVSKPRMRLTTTLAPMQAAGTALGWLRALTVDRTPEPLLWPEVRGLLDVLDSGTTEPESGLAIAGLRMLEAAGWALDLTACVRCRAIAPAERRVTLSIADGGIVCRSCGGGEVQLSAEQRMELLKALAEARQAQAQQELPVRDITLGRSSAERARLLVDRAISVHGRGGR